MSELTERYTSHGRQPHHNQATSITFSPAHQVGLCFITKGIRNAVIALA